MLPRSAIRGSCFMIRGLSLLCAGIVIAGCFACAPPPAMAFSGPSPLPIASPTCPGDSTFLSHVLLVSAGYDPSNNVANPPPPGIGTPIDSNSPYAPALVNAFQLAPTAFQSRLCSLTAIYINGPANCGSLAACTGNSWGYRPANASNQSYVAISAALWTLPCADGTTPYVLSCFESDLLDAALGLPAANAQKPRHGHANSEAENFYMTILAALAHEVGHMRWFQYLNPNQPGTPNYNPNSFCASGIQPGFFTYSWQGPQAQGGITVPSSWLPFGYRDPTNLHLPGDPQTATIDYYIRNNDLRNAAPLLDRLYLNGDPWPSFFSTLSPEEDFVETYKFYVLTHVQDTKIVGAGHLKSLPTTIYGAPTPYNENIPADYFSSNGKPHLHIKTDCVAAII